MLLEKGWNLFKPRRYTQFLKCYYNNDKTLKDNVTDPEGQQDDENVEHLPLTNDEYRVEKILPYKILGPFLLH